MVKLSHGARARHGWMQAWDIDGERVMAATLMVLFRQGLATFDADGWFATEAGREWREDAETFLDFPRPRTIQEMARQQKQFLAKHCDPLMEVEVLNDTA